jgi:LSD1 subclass zinc finger protein
MRDVLYCPGCQRRLQLPDEAYGKSVQCPSCQRVFIAEPNMTSAPGGTGRTAGAPAPTRPPPARTYDDVGEIDRPRSRRRRDEEDDDDRYRPRRPVPHRGGEILTFGLLALLPCPLTSIIFGIIAWMMANADLREMRSGRMDRDGEGLTQAGRVLGIIGLAFWPLACGCVMLSGTRF